MGIQLIDGDGTFNVTGLDNFMKEVKLSTCGVSYAVVSIMGPQSSGKSTLLNHLFGTKFREMDCEEGRSQTTQGIWLAKGVDIQPCTLVMDLEGNDSREREDDTTFEKQSALFALAVSHIVLINMWCKDIGREQASNKPLLKIVFQVMKQLFSPRKITLLFVIRDKTKSPKEKLDSILRKDIQKRKLEQALAEPVKALLAAADSNTWLEIRELLQRETRLVVFGLSSLLSGFNFDEKIISKALTRLADHGRSVVEEKAREEAGNVLIHMGIRFLTYFVNEGSTQRVQNMNDIKACQEIAESASLKLLAAMAAIRLDDDPDDIKDTLISSLVPAASDVTADDPLAASTWKMVPSTRTLITPIQCGSLWKEFKAETDDFINQAFSPKKKGGKRKLFGRILKGSILAGSALVSLATGDPSSMISMFVDLVSGGSS